MRMYSLFDMEGKGGEGLNREGAYFKIFLDKGGLIELLRYIQFVIIRISVGFHLIIFL